MTSTHTTPIDISADPGESRESLQTRATFLANITGQHMHAKGPSESFDIAADPSLKIGRDPVIAKRTKRILSIDEACARANAILDDYAQYVIKSGAHLGNIINTMNTLPPEIRSLPTVKRFREFLITFHEGLDNCEMPDPVKPTGSPTLRRRDASYIITTLREQIGMIDKDTKELVNLFLPMGKEIEAQFPDPNDPKRTSMYDTVEQWVNNIIDLDKEARTMHTNIDKHALSSAKGR